MKINKVQLDRDCHGGSCTIIKRVFTDSGVFQRDTVGTWCDEHGNLIDGTDLEK